MTNHDSTTIFTSDNRRCGHVRGGVFHRVIRNNHFLQKPPALALEVGVIAQCRQAGAVRCEFHHAETGDIWRATLDDFDLSGVNICRGGFPPQRALVLACWKVERANPPEEYAKDDRGHSLPRAPKAIQGRLL